VGPEVVAALAVIGYEVKHAVAGRLASRCGRRGDYPVERGNAASLSEVQAVARAVPVPTLVGSGVTLDNLHDYRDADAPIVGSSIKHGGVWSGASTNRGPMRWRVPSSPGSSHKMWIP